MAQLSGFFIFMNYPVPCICKKIKNKSALVSVLGSKSITARALFIAALAKGTSTLYGAGLSDDCLTFIDCLKSLGIKVYLNGTTVTVEGCGGRLPVKSGEVYVGSAGTAARFITALLAFSDGEFLVRSSEQMKKRPMGDLIAALEGAGACFEFLEKKDCFPFKIFGTSTPAKDITVDITKSSQFMSAVLMAGVCAKGGVRVSASGSHGTDYIDMTADMMWSFGAGPEKRALESGAEYTVNGAYSARKYDIEPDISAACYFYAMNRILGTDIKVRGVMPRSMQGDIKFIELMKGGFDGGEADMSSFSDQALTMAAIAPYFSKPTHICGIEHIRGQECDRIEAMAANLRAMGVECTAGRGDITIYPSQPKPARINTFGDHRVAMSFAVTGLRADGIVIENAEVCSKTFANFFEVLDGVVRELTDENV